MVSNAAVQIDRGAAETAISRRRVPEPGSSLSDLRRNKMKVSGDRMTLADNGGSDPRKPPSSSPGTAGRDFRSFRRTAPPSTIQAFTAAGHSVSDRPAAPIAPGRPDRTTRPLPKPGSRGGGATAPSKPLPTPEPKPKVQPRSFSSPGVPATKPRSLPSSNSSSPAVLPRAKSFSPAGGVVNGKDQSPPHSNMSCSVSPPSSSSFMAVAKKDMPVPPRPMRTAASTTTLELSHNYGARSDIKKLSPSTSPTGTIESKDVPVVPPSIRATAQQNVENDLTLLLQQKAASGSRHEFEKLLGCMSDDDEETEAEDEDEDITNSSRSSAVSPEQQV